MELSDVYIIGDDIDKIERELDERSGFEKKTKLKDDERPVKNFDKDDTKVVG